MRADLEKLDYTSIVRELESLGVMPDRPPSLLTMVQGLDQLFYSDEVGKLDPEKTILIAGTNGKGSVAATLEALFLAAGKKVGLYTSPHLEETTERIRLSGQDISQELFCEVYREVISRTTALKLTHFEVLTLMAAWLFYSNRWANERGGPLDWVILEVGLGGTWDATNAIPHRHCVITSLGYDHQAILGKSLEEIALNKFGIIPSGRPSDGQTDATVVHSPFPSEIQDFVKKVKATLPVREWRECVPFEVQVDLTEAEPSFSLQTQWGTFPMALAGRRAGLNSATALTLFDSLGYRPEQFKQALSQVRWPGRMERIESPKCPCPLYLSGDHNPKGIESLLDLLPYYRRKRLHVLLGVGKDKDLEGILEPLFQLEKTSIYLTESPFRGRSLPEYGTWLERVTFTHPDPIQALDEVFARAHSSDLVLVTGSLYLVGYLRKKLRD